MLADWLETHPLAPMLALLLLLVLSLGMFRWGQARARRQAAVDWERERQLVQLQHRQAVDKYLDECDRLQEERQALQAELAELRNQYRQLELESVTERMQHAAAREKLASERAQLEQHRQMFAREFERLAEQLFDTRVKQMDQTAKLQWQQLIGPFKEQLSHFYNRVDAAHRDDLAQRHQLSGQLEALLDQSRRLGDEASQLSLALKGNNKVLGNWGEVVLTRLLEQCGLQAGREFELQPSYTLANGRRLQPDVVIKLPESRQLIIDAKASLVAFQAYVNADGEADQAAHLARHVESIRSHIKDLSSKQYSQLTSIDSVDFVLMFLPLEAAFTCAVQAAPDLLSFAYQKNVVLVGPSGLLVALKSVENLWQRHRQNENVHLIVASAGRLFDQFALFAESLNEVGNCLDRAQAAYHTSLRRAAGERGGVLQKIKDLQTLGAKVERKLPVQFEERVQHLQ